MAFPCLKKKMIGSLLIKLKPLVPFKVRGKGEDFLYHLFLSVLQQKNQNLATEIDGPKSVKPVTLSPFLRGIKYSRGYSSLFPRETIPVKITYLRQDILEPLTQGFFALTSKRDPLKFSDGVIIIEKVDLQKATQANFTTFQNLLAQASDESRVVLEFCSPTSIQAKSEHLDFPLPELVFSSLVDRWNAFSEDKIPAEIKKEFKKIIISWLRLTTEFVYYSKHRARGFIGKVAYTIPKTSSEETRRRINALADFAFYSGVGRNTIKGMGQTRREKK
jgi:CRISPR-associated endoribonuclease Cas6